jgi:hypothetical protein
VRESGDGKKLGLAKTVAGLTGMGTDDIVRRAAAALPSPAMKVRLLIE